MRLKFCAADIAKWSQCRKKAKSPEISKQLGYHLKNMCHRNVLYVFLDTTNTPETQFTLCKGGFLETVKFLAEDLREIGVSAIFNLN